MKALVIHAASAALVATASTAQAGETVSKTYDLNDFSAIEIGGAYQLDVEVGGDYSVTLSGPEEEMARAEAVVRDGTLTLGTKKRIRGVRHHGDHESVLAVVTMPALDRLSVSGVVDANITDVDAGAFRVNLSGVGEVTIEGRCGALDARVSGVGELNASELECRTADVSLSGMGEASVYAREAATAEVSGMGEINIYGSPKKVDKRGGFFAEITVH